MQTLDKVELAPRGSTVRKARGHVAGGGVPKAGAQQDRHWREKGRALQLWGEEDM